MGKPRDTQRSAVYAWEDRAGLIVYERPESILTLTECQGLVNRIWASYMGGTLHIPTVKDGRGRRSACYMIEDHSVRFPQWSRQPAMVAHEVAHAIIEFRTRCTQKLSWHGPEFVRVYCELLVAFLGYDPEHLLREMTTGKRKVRIGTTDSLPWRKVAYAMASRRRAA